MSATQGKGFTPSGNQPTTSTLGGASAYPTPANNAGGGAGWGDSGFFKGVSKESNRLSSGSGESSTSKLSSISGEMSGLRDQKAAGEEQYKSDVAEAGAIPTEAEGNPSFMKHKPGGSDTLPGWNKAKDALGGVLGNE